jgi:hypothetical protein
MFGSVEAISDVNNSKATNKSFLQIMLRWSFRTFAFVNNEKATGAWLTLSTRWEKLDHNNKFVKWDETSLSNIDNWLHRNIFKSPSSEQKTHWRHQLNFCLTCAPNIIHDKKRKTSFIQKKQRLDIYTCRSINFSCK